jgi:YbbR domain-containing protein
VNKLIDGFFEHKILVRVLSVLMAILLWFIVLDSSNPMITRTLSVSISGNPEVLDDSNLRIIGSGAPTTVDITIRGRRSKVSAVSSNDFKMNLDYNQVKTSGLVTLLLDEPVYTGQNQIQIVSVNPLQTQLRLERITGVEFPVVVRWDGELPKGYKAVNLRIDPSTVKFEDKESLINKVESVVVTISAKELDNTVNITRRVLVLDAAGKAISQFDGKRTVTASFDLVHTLPVTTGISGTPAPDWYVTGFSTAPKEVQVLGKYEALSALSAVQAEDINVEGKQGSFSIDLSLKVPEGFTLYGIKPQVLAEVQMEKLAIRDMSVPVESISVAGMDPLNNRILRFLSTEVVLKVKGKASGLTSLTAKDFSLSVDATGYLEGEYVLPVYVKCPKGFTMAITPSVRAIIEAVPVPEPSPSPTADPLASPTADPLASPTAPPADATATPAATTVP